MHTNRNIQNTKITKQVRLIFGTKADHGKTRFSETKRAAFRKLEEKKQDDLRC